MNEELSARSGPRQDMLADLSPEKRALLTLRLAQRRSAADAPIPRLPRHEGNHRLPASPGQERLFFHQQLDPRSPTYLVPVAMRLRGSLDPGALDVSLRRLLERHEALRTGFEADAEHGVVQHIRAPGDVTLDLERGVVPETDIPAQVERIVRRPFDLSRPPLLRAALWEVAGDAEPSWLLALCMHHIVADGWSLGILVDDLAEIYRAHLADVPPDLPDLAGRYADFTAWQRDWLASTAPERQLAYWREELADVPAVDFSGGRSPQPAASATGNTVPVQLPPNTVAELRRVGDSERATVFMVLLAVLAVVLERWSGTSDQVISTAVAGRCRPELERLVGFFVNTLPLRIRLAGAGSFRDLLRRARDSSLTGYAHQDLPFERIVHEVGAARRNALSPLVQTMLSLRNVRLDTPHLHGVTVEVLEVPVAGADLDLSVELAPDDHGGLSGWAVYSTRVFDAQTATELVASLRTVVDAVVGHPDIALADIPVLPPVQRDRVLRELSDHPESVPAPDSLPARLTAQATATPDAPAVTDDRDGSTLCYRALDERANQVAWWLHRRGIRPETRVGVLLDRGAGHVVALLGTLKAGAVYVPLDPSYPASRLDRMVRDCRPQVVLTSAELADQLTAEWPTDVVVLSALNESNPGQGSDRATSPPPVTPDPDNAAYVRYTSGSTGTPKGAVVSYRAIANRIAGTADDFDFGADDVILHHTAIGFDPALWEILVPLWCGARSVIADPDRHGDSAYLVDVIARREVTGCYCVPSMLREVLSVPSLGTVTGSLRRVVCGGEELSTALAERFHQLLPHVDLRNRYGPAEGAIYVSVHRVTAPVSSPVPIGRPVAGTRLYVLDDQGRPVPIGTSGELHIGGVQVARGYFDDARHTAERFRPDPFGDGQRLYRTGDRVRWHRDGHLEFLGRVDQQIKIRGQRIEPGEIEAALRGHPAVADAVVVAAVTPAGESMLAAYVTTVDGCQPPTTTALRQFLRTRLPPAMTPNRLVNVDAFPLTPHGKLDREALAGVTLSAESNDTAPTSPDDPLQHVLAEVWTDELSEDWVTDIHRDFFEAGGHSLMATRIMLQISQLFRFDVPLRTFFEAPTIAALAEVVRARGIAHGIDADRVASTILRVRQMTDEEVDTGLHARRSGGGEPDGALP